VTPEEAPDGDAGLHRERRIESSGAPPQAAEAAVVLLHGRGATTRGVLDLVEEFYHRGVLYLAPQATHNRWYPALGFGPLEHNEPWLSAALARVDDALGMAADAGIPPERTLLFGFSQGACLAAEFVARTPRRYGGLVALSGGLLGERVGEYEGSLDGTPVFLGCSATDPYVSAERVRATAAVFEALDGRVTTRLYEDLGHAINDEEMHRTDALVGDLLDGGH
jgi:phospholipase/carboxylesterase